MILTSSGVQRNNLCDRYGSPRVSKGRTFLNFVRPYSRAGFRLKSRTNVNLAIVFKLTFAIEIYLATLISRVVEL
jgi:hypothetical protein